MKTWSTSRLAQAQADKFILYYRKTFTIRRVNSHHLYSWSCGSHIEDCYQSSSLYWLQFLKIHIIFLFSSELLSLLLFASIMNGPMTLYFNLTPAHFCYIPNLSTTSFRQSAYFARGEIFNCIRKNVHLNLSRFWSIRVHSLPALVRSNPQSESCHIDMAS